MKINIFALALASLAVMLGSYSEGQAQFKGKKRKNGYNSRKPLDNPFLKSQWWLGFRAGANLTEADPQERYSGFSPINYTIEENQKEYGGFEQLGGHAGLEITYYHKGFSFSFQPNYRRQRFLYSNSFLWSDENDASNRLELNYDQDHQLDYIEFPLFVKYDFTQNTFRPFVQVGVYYAILTSANKSVEVSGADFASGDLGPFENEEVIIGAEDLFINSSIGVAGGIGASYDVQNTRLVFDVTYRYGLNNVTDVQNRFSENQLAGIGDALDDIHLRNISFTFGLLFPLRFISKKYDAIN